MRKLCTLVLCFLMAVSQLLAQTNTVTGKVTDDKGMPVAGATILERGTKNGVSAANDGTFSIKVKAGATLVISAIGFDGIQIKASNSSMLIGLKAGKDDLSEVVVTAQGTRYQ